MRAAIARRVAPRCGSFARLGEWPDRGQRDRALTSLIDDGLVEISEDVAHLPRGKE